MGKEEQRKLQAENELRSSDDSDSPISESASESFDSEASLADGSETVDVSMFDDTPVSEDSLASDDSEIVDVSMFDETPEQSESKAEKRLQNRLELIRQEEEKLKKEKEELDQQLAQWQEKKTKLENMKSSLLSADGM